MSQSLFSDRSELEIKQLVDYACEAAAELHVLDETLTRLENQQAMITGMPEQWMEAHSRCERARDTLVQRLLESIAALGLAQSEITLAPKGIGQRLSESTTQIRQELEIQAQVLREMETLLGPR